MTDKKTGFIFYFDYYAALSALPPEQRGWLITALCVYADRVWRDETVTAEEILAQFPQLSPQSRVAWQFMTSAVDRDTQRWLRQRQVRMQRRQQHAGADPDGIDPQEQARRFREDALRSRRALDVCREQGG